MQSDFLFGVSRYIHHQTDPSPDSVSSLAPSADAVGDATQGLEIGPFGELVVSGGGRDVCADDADGEVWDVGEGDLGAVELGVKG